MITRLRFVLSVLLLAIVSVGFSGLVAADPLGNGRPSISTQPTNQTVAAGQTATFTVTATGRLPLRYQWQKNNVAISGATSSSYTTPAASSSANGAQFTVLVRNRVGSVTSNAATLTVTAARVSRSTITSQPASQTVTAGRTATFTVAATGTAPLSYQWRKNGTAIAGATSSSYTTPATARSSDNGAQFTVLVSNTAGSTTSSAATLTVTAAPLQITTSNLPAGQVQALYSTTLQATGGVSPYTWSLFSGLLPTGLTLQPDGTISGTPTFAGVFPFIVQVQDAAAQTVSATFSLNIATAVDLLWLATMEVGDLSEWYVPGPLGRVNFTPPGAGGGEWDSGSYTPSEASQDFAHTGSFSAKLSADATTVDSGVRLFRWLETRQNPDLYFSAWLYVPQQYNIAGWTNIWQWKSQNAGSSDPFFNLQMRNRSTGAMYLRMRNENSGSTWDQNIADIPVGKWFQIEAFHHCAADSSGHVTIWMDGVQIYDVQGQPTRYSSSDCQWSVNAYGSRVTPTPFVLYVDDVAIGTARVGPAVGVVQPPMAH
jgi:hypothetical protein